MKNKDIIRNTAIQAGLLTEQAGEELYELPLHTAAEWKKRGYVIKEGAQGIEVKLWRKKEGQDKFYLAKA